MFLGISVCGIWLHSKVWHKHMKHKSYKTHPRTPWRRCGAGGELPWKSVWPLGRAEAAWGRWRCVYRLTYRLSAPLYPERESETDETWVLDCPCHCCTAGVIRVVWKGQPLGRPTVTDYSLCTEQELIFQTERTRLFRKSGDNLKTVILAKGTEQQNKRDLFQWVLLA